MSSLTGFMYEVGMDKIPGTEPVHKFGRNVDLANGTWEPITNSGTINWLTVASAVRIKAGGSADDDAAGTGARSVTVEGLDESWALASETIVTNGVDASLSTSTTFIRVFRATVAEAGAYTGTNAAEITIETTGGTALIDVPAASGRSEFCAYTIPADKRGLLTHADCNVSSTKAADVRIVTREGANSTADTFTAAHIIWFRDGVAGRQGDEFGVPIILPPYTDIWFEGNGTGAGVECEAEFDLLLVDL